jgi:hypothetical protein
MSSDRVPKLTEYEQRLIRHRRFGKIAEAEGHFPPTPSLKGKKKVRKEEKRLSYYYYLLSISCQL